MKTLFQIVPAEQESLIIQHYTVRGSFLMILFGICLSIRKPRTSMAVGLTLSIGVIFAYYTMLKIGQSLGYTGVYPAPYLYI